MINEIYQKCNRSLLIRIYRSRVWPELLHIAFYHKSIIKANFFYDILTFVLIHKEIERLHLRKNPTLYQSNNFFVKYLIDVLPRVVLEILIKGNPCEISTKRNRK